MQDTISIERDARGVATLWLDRPAKHNAMSGPMIAQLHQAVTQLGRDSDVRVVVLAARGATFCAGGDLGWMRDQFDADAATRAQEARKLAYMLQALNTIPKPLIGRVQGNAFGGGVGLMAVCDVVVADLGAQMALSETRLGLIPATIGPYVAARMGEAAARRVFMSSRRFDATEAMTLNLVGQAVATGDLDRAVEAEVTPYLSCAPGAVGQAKALLRSFGPPIDDAVIERSIAALSACWAGAEAQEGIAAFFDKSRPGWMD